MSLVHLRPSTVDDTILCDIKIMHPTGDEIPARRKKKKKISTTTSSVEGGRVHLGLTSRSSRKYDARAARRYRGTWNNRLRDQLYVFLCHVSKNNERILCHASERRQRRRTASIISRGWRRNMHARGPFRAPSRCTRALVFT